MQGEDRFSPRHTGALKSGIVFGVRTSECHDDVLQKQPLSPLRFARIIRANPRLLISRLRTQQLNRGYQEVGK